MEMTLRVPDALHAEAAAYAASLGLSLNGLVAVALRDYLDARPAARGRAVAEPPAIEAKAGAGREALPPDLEHPAKLSPADRMRRKAQAKRAGRAP
ncbi:MAG: toxin-antitoxin system HicB family antitoxin [Burkholderiaceae bacterium]|jgi:hypothetical protein|nr:toxin-antitoxin system HicB family antitoxin [Burkholderiaceae bacterium]MEB2351111.1 toxin-antitoxin system HicB family antitoxin [Burkholderiaceae bacterium]